MRRVLVVLACLFVLPLMASASFMDNPPPLAGWTHSPAVPNGDSPQRHGIALSGSAVVRGSPVIAEIDGNSTNGQEAAVAGGDGRLYIYRANGSLLWSADVLPGTCTPAANDNRINSAPAVGTLYGDGVPYVAVTYGTLTASNCDGGLAVYRGSNGALQWRFSTRAWQASEGYPPEGNYGVVASPALADSDADGRMELGFGGLDRNIYLLNHDGTVRWYYHAADVIWSSPAFADVNADGRLDLLIGSSMSANPHLTPPTQDGGFVYAFDTRARTPKRVEFCHQSCAGTAYIYQKFFDQVIFSSPVVAEILPGSPGMEIVIGNGCTFPLDSANKRGKWLKVLRLSDGATLQTLNLPAGATCVQSSAAVGDLDDDGKLEIAATLNGATGWGGDGVGRIAAWRPTVSSNPWWSMTPQNASVGANDPYLGDIASPVVADLDGNGSLEVIASNVWDVIVVNGRTGTQMSCGGSGCGATPSLFAWYTLKSTPAVGDLNGDDKPEVLIGGAHNYDNNGRDGYFYAWSNFGGFWASSPGTQPAHSTPWGMFRGNAAHSGVLGESRPSTRRTLFLPILFR